MAFHRKAQVWKAKLQSCPEPSNISHVMYGANNIQACGLIANVLAFVEIDRKCKIEIAFHLEAAFQTDQEQKIFYKNYNRHDEEEKMSLIIGRSPPYTVPPDIAASLPYIYLVDYHQNQMQNT